MDRISSINNIVEILRNKISAKKTNESSKKTSSTDETEVEDLLHANEFSNLESLIINRINKLNTEDENYQSKAKRIFIESVLIKEFGEQLADDQDFTDIVVDINNQITNNGILNKKLDKLLEQLTA
jgi:hypothetical protein